MNLLEKFKNRNKSNDLLKENELLRAKLKEYEDFEKDFDQNFLSWYTEQNNQTPKPEISSVKDKVEEVKEILTNGDI